MNVTSRQATSLWNISKKPRSVSARASFAPAATFITITLDMYHEVSSHGQVHVGILEIRRRPAGSETDEIVKFKNVNEFSSKVARFEKRMTGFTWAMLTKNAMGRALLTQETWEY